MTDAVKVAKGESADDWFCQRGNFWGTSSQITLCARCGGHEVHPHDRPRHYRDYFKPTFHMICDPCYEDLP